MPEAALGCRPFPTLALLALLLAALFLRLAQVDRLDGLHGEVIFRVRDLVVQDLGLTMSDVEYQGGQI